MNPRVLDRKQRTATDCGSPIQREALPQRVLIVWGAVAPETQLTWELISAKEEGGRRQRLRIHSFGAHDQDLPAWE
eukprot:7798609-Lingulodinium_polyedra.AAC.1